MRCKVRVLKFGTRASDGSVINEGVVREYLSTPSFQEDLAAHRMIGSLTHRVRNISAAGYSPEVAANLRKTVAKDDALLLIDSNCPPTHYIDKLWIENGALWAEIQIFDESGFDDQTIQAIRRLTSILKYSEIGISCVIVGYWSGSKDGTDELTKLVSLKGIDFTMLPSFPGSYVVEVTDNEGNKIEKSYSEIEGDRFEGYRVKTFSDLSSLNISVPKTSKINNQFTILKAKNYSSISEVQEQKEYSQAQVMERVRMGKLSPRIRFRRIILDFRAAIKAQGGIEKISPDSLKIMKSLFATDILGIMQELTPSIITGKNLNSLLGSSALSVSVRKATQSLMIPYRMAMQENVRQGFVSKARYQKIQEAYTEFIKSLIDYVFGTPVNQKLKEEEEEELNDGKN